MRQESGGRSSVLLVEQNKKAGPFYTNKWETFCLMHFERQGTDAILHDRRGELYRCAWNEGNRGCAIISIPDRGATLQTVEIFWKEGLSSTTTGAQ
jgi:hypothetical protein